MKMLDCFSGYGGFSIAGDKLGIETVGFFEVDPYASSVLAFHWPEVKNHGDINYWREQEIPHFDILCGGSPCQDFSVAGGRTGLDGGRSGLFFRFIEIAKEYTPEYIVWENVVGTVSANKGWDFATILTEMASAGYYVQWGIVNGKWFVPQNRERLFVVGYLRGNPGREVFPVEGNESKVRSVGREVSFCLDANYSKGPSPSGHQSNKRQLVQVGNVDTKGHNSLWGRVYDPYEGIGVTLKAEGGGTGAKTGLYRVALTERRTEEAKEIRKKVRKEEGRDFSPRRGKELVPRDDGLGNCLTAGSTVEHLVLDDFRIRKLTPLECERLMGLTDGWTKTGIRDEEVVTLSNTQRYKLCGNGVIPQVVEEIIRRVLKYDEFKCIRSSNKEIPTGG